MQSNYASIYTQKQYCDILKYYENPHSDKELINDLCSFFPVRIMGQNYVNYCQREIEHEQYDFNQFFQHEHTINLYLAVDAPMLSSYCNEIITLHKLITCQPEKYKGFLYWKTRKNALELVIMSFKSMFYIPCFITATMNEKYAKAAKGNVLFVIDTTEYNENSMIIRKSQNRHKFKNEECIITCYNIFQWISIQLEDDYVLVNLKIKDYNQNREVDKIKDMVPNNIHIAYLKCGHPIKKIDLDSKELFNYYEMLHKDIFK